MNLHKERGYLLNRRVLHLLRFTPCTLSLFVSVGCLTSLRGCRQYNRKVNCPEYNKCLEPRRRAVGLVKEEKEKNDQVCDDVVLERDNFKIFISFPSFRGWTEVACRFEKCCMNISTTVSSISLTTMINSVK